MTRPRSADDFATIRARMEELRRERAGDGAEGDNGLTAAGREGDAERRRRARLEGWPPPWIPTIFARKPRV